MTDWTGDMSDKIFFQSDMMSDELFKFICSPVPNTTKENYNVPINLKENYIVCNTLKENYVLHNT